MTLYKTSQYLRYKLKAKGRHGTHSPFVYALVEDLLTQPADDAELMDKLIHYFRIKQAGTYTASKEGMTTTPLPINEKAQPDHKNEKVCAMEFNRLILLQNDPAKSPDDMIAGLGANDILAVKPLYKNEDYTRQWELLKAHPRVKMSIDFFVLGLLLFREEFKEPQHFILKY